MSASRERIAVIGGGMGGSLTALLAKRAGYDVMHLGKQDLRLNGASVIAARLHLGGEYPLDRKTALDCLKGAIVWKLVMPDGIYTDQTPMRFTVSEATEKEGLLTVKKYLDHYEMIRRRYEQHFQRVRSVLGWSEDQTAAALFGLPKQENFYRALKKGKGRENDLRHYHNIAGGFQSQEPGLNTMLYLAFVDRALSNAGIRYLPLEVTKIERKKDHYLVYTDSGVSPLEADQVVIAAWEGGPTLELPHRDPSRWKPVHAYRRSMAMLDIANISADRRPPPTFVMRGDSKRGLIGAMFSPYGMCDATVYVTGPEASYADGKELTPSDPATPTEWEREPLNRQWRLDNIHRIATEQYFPFLKEAQPARLATRVTLNFQRDLKQRRHEKVAEIQPGLITVYPTKVTLAPQAAIEAVEMLQARSRLRAMKTGAKKKIPPARDALELALPGNYAIADAADLDSMNSANFARNRDMPETLSLQRPGYPAKHSFTKHDLPNRGRQNFTQRYGHREESGRER